MNPNKIINKIELINYLNKLLSNKNSIISVANINLYNYKNNLLKNNNYLNLILLYVAKLCVKTVVLCNNLNIKNSIISLIKCLNYIDMKNNLINSLKFMGLLIIYIVEKYYYKTDDIDFIIKTRVSRKVFNFFLKLNKLKKILTFSVKKDAPYVRLLYYYTLTITYCITIAPFVWFLLRVVTDPMNWITPVFDQTNLSLLL